MRDTIKSGMSKMSSLGQMPKNLPVMVWLHGGAFVRGDGSSTLFAPDYFMSEETNPVVLVTLNYRGAFIKHVDTKEGSERCIK